MLCWNFNHKLPACIMMKDGSDKGFHTKEGSGFSCIVVCYTWAFISKGKQESLTRSLIWSVFISHCVLEMEAVFPHSRGVLPFLYNHGRGTFVLLGKHFSHVWMSSHIHVHTHTPLCFRSSSQSFLLLGISNSLLTHQHFSCRILIGVFLVFADLILTFTFITSVVKTVNTNQVHLLTGDPV